jgi:hypothetical protein
MKEEIINILIEFNKEANDLKVWEGEIHGMSSKFAAKRFYEKYAKRIMDLYEPKLYNEYNTPQGVMRHKVAQKESK